MPLWNLVLTGYPSAGKTLLARRLVQDKSDFVRINGDELLNSRIHPLRKRFLSNIFPRIHG